MKKERFYVGNVMASNNENYNNYVEKIIKKSAIFYHVKDDIYADIDNLNLLKLIYLHLKKNSSLDNSKNDQFISIIGNYFSQEEIAKKENISLRKVKRKKLMDVRIPGGIEY